MIEFRDVTMENFEEVINLKLKDDQEGFLENNLYSWRGAGLRLPKETNDWWEAAGKRHRPQNNESSNWFI